MYIKKAQLMKCIPSTLTPTLVKRLSHNSLYFEVNLFGLCKGIVYCGTMVVYKTPETIYLNTGGHRTATTKKKMNKLLSGAFHVFQKKGERYCDTPRATKHFTGDTMTIDLT